MLELVCFDMAGTTVHDDDLVMSAFGRVLDESGLSERARHDAVAYVIETMGQSKIDVFTHLFAEAAQQRNHDFEHHFKTLVGERGVTAIAGASELAHTLLSQGTDLALTTGFSPETRELLIDGLGWHDLFRVRVSPADAGRGRPFADMIWTCALRTRVSDISAVAVVGDTASDMLAGRRSGAGLIIGVLSGTGTRSQLLAAGADEVVASVADVSEFLVAD